MKIKKVKFFRQPLSFTTWIMALITSIFFVFLLVAVVSYTSFYDQQKAVIHNTLASNGSQAAEYINTQLADIENLLVLPIFAEKDDQFFADSAVYAETGEQSEHYAEELKKSLRTLFDYKTSIYSVAFYVPGRSTDSVLRGLDSKELISPEQQPWFQTCIKDLNGTPIIVPTHRLHTPKYELDHSIYVFGMARSVIDVQNSRVVGVLHIGINETTLYNFLRGMVSLDGQELIVTDGDGYVVSSTLRSAVGKQLKETELSDAFSDRDSEENLISETTVGWTDWKVYSVVPTFSITKEIAESSKIILLIMLILLLLLPISVMAISYRFVHPITNLTKEMKKVSKGDFSVRLYENGLKETSFLSSVFNQMLEELESMVKRKYIDKIALQELELQMLQYQINPHFLYNSIESIRMTALLNDDQEAAQMLFSLGKILRFSLSDTNEITTVRQEIEVLEEYIALHAVRFDDIYSIIIDVDEEIYLYRIPKLVLQPFVENAIEHGVSRLESGGEIFVKGRLEQNQVVFRIENNGSVIPREEIIRLNEELNNDEPTGDHIGIKNVHKRLKLLFGDEAGVSLGYSDEGKTEITVRIPALQQLPQGKSTEKDDK